MNDIIHILVIDDDKRIRHLLGKYLNEQGYYVTLAENSVQAKEAIEQFHMDLLIVDVMMPGQDGLEMTAELRQSNYKIPILMLTAMGEVSDRIKGLECGVDDYISKPFDPKELSLRIKAILSRTLERYNNSAEHISNITYFGNMQFDSSNCTLTCDGTGISITQSEEKIISFLAKNKNEVVRRELLAKSLGINERSTDVQITRLRQKIEDNPKNPIYIKTVRGTGYILVTN